MKQSELKILAQFMFLHANFFAAPFLETEAFNSWARQQSGMVEFSAELHEALETSKSIAYGEVSLLTNYRKAIVGNPTRSGDPDRRNCLLSGNLNAIWTILSNNEKLAQSIKKNMDKKFFEAWYTNRDDQSRMNALNKKFDHALEEYQAKKLKAIESLLSENVKISYQYNGVDTQNATKIVIQSDQNIIQNSELQILADKYNTAQSLRDTLTNPKVNTLMQLVNFSRQINKQETINKLTAGNDSDGIKVLKFIGYALSTLLFGLGLYLSYRNKGTIEFWKPELWKTEEDKLLDTTGDINKEGVISRLK